MPLTVHMKLTMSDLMFIYSTRPHACVVSPPDYPLVISVWGRLVGVWFIVIAHLRNATTLCCCLIILGMGSDISSCMHVASSANPNFAVKVKLSQITEIMVLGAMQSNPIYPVLPVLYKNYYLTSACPCPFCFPLTKVSGGCSRWQHIVTQLTSASQAQIFVGMQE